MDEKVPFPSIRYCMIPFEMSRLCHTTFDAMKAHQNIPELHIFFSTAAADQIDFSLASVAPPSFAACVLALNRHGLPLSKASGRAHSLLQHSCLLLPCSVR